MAAGHFRLDHLVFLVDANKVQAKGFVNLDMSIEPLARKLEAFNLDVREVANGHDVGELVELFTSLRQQRKGKPIAVILNTVKGKKVFDAQFNPNWHTSAPRTAGQAAAWLAELWEQDGAGSASPRSFPRCSRRRSRSSPRSTTIPTPCGIGRPRNPRWRSSSCRTGRAPARCATTWVSPCRPRPRNDRIVALDADLRSSTGLHIFEHFFPDRLVKCGIASRTWSPWPPASRRKGTSPFPAPSIPSRGVSWTSSTCRWPTGTSTSSSSAPTRPLHRQGGATHQSDKELSFLLRVPNLRVIEPGCIVELEQAMRCAAETPGPFYLRIVRCEVERDGMPEGYRSSSAAGDVVDHGCDVGSSARVPGRTARAAAEKLRSGESACGSIITQPQAVRPGAAARPRVEGGRHRDMENHCTSGGLYSLVRRPSPATASGFRSRPWAPIPTTSSTRSRQRPPRPLRDDVRSRRREATALLARRRKDRRP